MAEQFKVGDLVSWRVGNRSYAGEVIEVVAPNELPLRYGNGKGFNRGRQIARRNHESYVVKVNKATYWPVQRLTATLTQATNTVNQMIAQSQQTSVRQVTLPDGSIIEVTERIIKPATKYETDYIFVLDKSGSMSGNEMKVREMVRKEIETLLESARTLGTLAIPRVTLIYFNDRVEVQSFRVAADHLPLDNLLLKYMPNGGTALFDACGRAITDMEMTDTQAVVLHVFTDGLENASFQWKAMALGTKFAELQRTGKWTLAFMLPPGYKDTFRNTFPTVASDNLIEWENVGRATQVATQATRSYMTGRASGQVVNNSYFVQPDLSKISADALNALKDLSALFRVYDIEQEIAIKDFIEAKTGKPYIIGSGYYQLMKTEKTVQSYKGVLLRDRFTGRVFGGIEARKLIGLPTNADAKIEPGNHAQFDIFIESTSVNRKLSRGTKLLHDYSQVIDKQPTWDHTVAR